MPLSCPNVHVQDLAFDSEPQDAPCDATGDCSGNRESRSAARGDALDPASSHGLGLRLDSETQVGMDAEPQGEAMGGRGFSLGLRLDSETQPDFGLGEAQPAVRPCLPFDVCNSSGMYQQVDELQASAGIKTYCDILERLWQDTPVAT